MPVPSSPNHIQVISLRGQQPVNVHSSLRDVAPAQAQIRLLREHVQAARSAMTAADAAPAQEPGEAEDGQRGQPEELGQHGPQRQHKQVAGEADESEPREEQDRAEGSDLDGQRAVAAQPRDEVACMNDAEHGVETVPELTRQ